MIHNRSCVHQISTNIGLLCYVYAVVKVHLQPLAKLRLASHPLRGDSGFTLNVKRLATGTLSANYLPVLGLLSSLN